MHSTDISSDGEAPKYEITLYYNKDFYLKLLSSTPVTERTRRRSATMLSSKRLPNPRSNPSSVESSQVNIEPVEEPVLTAAGMNNIDDSVKPFTLKYSAEPSVVSKSLNSIRGYHINEHDLTENSLNILLSDENWKNDCDLVADYLNKYREFYKILETRRRQLKKELDSSDGEKHKSDSGAIIDTRKELPFESAV